jgi:hypothetical protein
MKNHMIMGLLTIKVDKKAILEIVETKIALKIKKIKYLKMRRMKIKSKIIKLIVRKMIIKKKAISNNKKMN